MRVIRVTTGKALSFAMVLSIFLIALMSISSYYNYMQVKNELHELRKSVEMMYSKEI